MAAPQRGCLGFLTICLATLALMECAVIGIAVLPMPSTRTDWLIATVYVAPMATVCVLLPLVIAARIIADTLELFHHIRQWTQKKHHQHHPVDETPSPSTPSAVSPSSSSGWPSVGRSYTSHLGKERPPWH